MNTESESRSGWSRRWIGAIPLMMAMLTVGAFLLIGRTAKGATFEVWLVVPPGPIAANTSFPVQVWGQIHGSDAIGLSDFAVTITSLKTGFVEPKAGANQFVEMTFGPEMTNFSLKISAEKGDYDRDGDADAVEFCAGDVDGSAIGLAVSSPLLLATETWTMLGNGTSNFDELVPHVAPTSEFWNTATNRIQFSGYQMTSVIVGVQPSFPRCSYLARNPDGAIQLTITGVTSNQTVLVQASTNLSSWQNISTNVPSTNCFQITDHAATNLNARFYRVVQLQ